MTSTKRLAALFAATAVVAFTLTACGGGGGSSTPPPPPPPPPPPATGTLTLTDCQIPASASSCSSTVAWTSKNAKSLSYTVDTTKTSVSTASGSQPVTIGYGDHPVTLDDSSSSTHLATGTLHATCASGTWDGTICAPPASWPPLSLTAMGIEVDGANQLPAGCNTASDPCWQQANADGTVKVVQSGVVVDGLKIDFSFYRNTTDNFGVHGQWNVLPVYDKDGSLFGPDIFGGQPTEIDKVEGNTQGVLYHDVSSGKCFQEHLDSTGHNFVSDVAPCVF